MAPVQFSPELLNRIISFIHTPFVFGLHQSPASDQPRNPLLALALTSKAFNQAATPIIYADGMCLSERMVHLACRTVLSNPSPHESRNYAPVNAKLYFKTIVEAIRVMPNLEYLCLWTASGDSTLFKPDPAFPFQLKAFKCNLAWNEELSEFICKQEALQEIIHYPSHKNDPGVLEPGTLLNLQSYTGPLLPGFDLVDGRTHPQYPPQGLPPLPPVINLCILTGGEAHTSNLWLTLHQGQPIISYFRRISKTLRAIRLESLGPEGLGETLEELAAAVPMLRHLGTCSLPLVKRNGLHRALVQFNHLQHIELDVTALHLPKLRAPAAFAHHIRLYGRSAISEIMFEERLKVFCIPFRQIANEMRTFCHSLTYVTFWRDDENEEKAIFKFIDESPLDQIWERRQKDVNAIAQRGYESEYGTAIVEWIPWFEWTARKRWDDTWMIPA
ncbi:hypothetical protein DL96DRAFT_1599743 [Flagelloscypha sp. PMI_526]|nr:hypothetical protein DL96DRAFT_1599743 [Flagelloscypha sp. PMI_526]